MIPFLISPPFGSYVDTPNSWSVLGSFTLHRRPGRWYKTAQFFWDNLTQPVPGGYVNRIGLRNPGIRTLALNHEHLHLYSLVGLEADDWRIMLDDVLLKRAEPHLRFELNLGCPNVHEYGIEQAVLADYCHHFWCGIKLPADREKALKIADMAVAAGAHYLHAGNTFATKRGGISGKLLKPVNLPIVEALARYFPNINIVGGGGIYSFDDLIDYRNAGANSYSLATIWFKPLQARHIMRLYRSRYGQNAPRQQVQAPST